MPSTLTLQLLQRLRSQTATQLASYSTPGSQAFISPPRQVVSNRSLACDGCRCAPLPPPRIHSSPVTVVPRSLPAPDDAPQATPSLHAIATMSRQLIAVILIVCLAASAMAQTPTPGPATKNKGEWRRRVLHRAHALAGVSALVRSAAQAAGNSTRALPRRLHGTCGTSGARHHLWGQASPLTLSCTPRAWWPCPASRGAPCVDVEVDP